MNGLHLDWQQVIDGNGIGISIVGILAVFTGLFLIYLSISVLPRLLGIMHKILRKIGYEPSGHAHGSVPKPKVKKSLDTSTEPVNEDEDLIAAIAYVIAAEAELEATSDYTKLTIRRDDTQHVWGVAGRMRTLATRKITTIK